MEEQKEKKKIIRKLKNKYRLVILNDTSFEERFSYRLTPLNLLTLFLTSAVLLVLIVAITIIFTPLREYIPGYTDVNLRKDLTKQVLKSDSLEKELRRNTTYLKNIKLILSGKPPLPEDSLIDAEPILGEVDPSVKSKEDSILREYVEREDSYSLNVDNEETNSALKIYFFPPLKGAVTDSYDVKKEHFGIDIVAPKDEAIKATLEGTVIFAEWTVETGYVIQLQHTNNLTSIYKHNSVLLKRTGDIVKAGEAIAIIGNSGELSSGPHLHFELWQNGVSLDPLEYVNFN